MRPTGAPKIILDNAFMTLKYHPRGKIVHHEFHQPTSGAVFREVLTRGLEYFEKHRARKWLSDDRENGALHPDDAQWAIDEWSPRVIAAGWTHWAIVMPGAVLGKINMKRFIARYSDLGVDVQIFSGAEEALDWLRNPRAADA